MKDLISTLLDYEGQYEGFGINHDNQEFIGDFLLSSIINGKGIEIKFKAKSHDGMLFHEEITYIGPNDSESYSLWTLNNNIPYMYEHKFKDIKTTEGAFYSMMFTYNDPGDKFKFRETITIDLWPKGELSYQYAWGLPGGDFQDRSGVKLKKI